MRWKSARPPPCLAIRPALQLAERLSSCNDNCTTRWCRCTTHPRAAWAEKNTAVHAQHMKWDTCCCAVVPKFQITWKRRRTPSLGQIQMELLHFHVPPRLRDWSFLSGTKHQTSKQSGGEMAGQAAKKAAKASESTANLYFPLILAINIIYVVLKGE